MDKQKKYLMTDIDRSRTAKSLEPSDKQLMYQINADFRLAENPDTARLLVRERHDMLTKAEARKLNSLRATLIELAMMCDSITF